MEPVVGVFESRVDAIYAVDELRTVIKSYHVNVLAPNASEEEMKAVPTTKDMPPVGKYIGSALGGAVGLGLGASFFLPGLGPITAVGLAATALFGAGGALAGGAAGEVVDQAAAEGLPVDELFLYEDAVRKGRTVVIALADNNEQAEAARTILAQRGAESIDAARESWWSGIRDAEEQVYQHQGQDFEKDEQAYRRGFEAALSLRTRGKPYEDVTAYLRERCPDVYDLEAFRQGYERGRNHYKHTLEAASLAPLE